MDDRSAAGNELDGLWTTADVADFLRVSPSSVRNRMEDAGLPHVYIGNALRFDPEAVRAWVKDRSATKGAAA